MSPPQTDSQRSLAGSKQRHHAQHTSDTSPAAGWAAFIRYSGRNAHVVGQFLFSRACASSRVRQEQDSRQD